VNIVIVSSNVTVNSSAFLSWAPGSGDWSTTPYVYDIKSSYLTCVPYLTLSNWFENRQPQRTQISTVTNGPLIHSKLKSNDPQCIQIDHNHKFSEHIFSRQCLGFSAHRSALMTKTDLTFSAFSVRLVDFTAQFCFCCKFLFHDKQHLTVAWFPWTNHMS